MASREMKPRWKRVLGAEYKAIGEDIGHVYVERFRLKLQGQDAGDGIQPKESLQGKN